MADYQAGQRVRFVKGHLGIIDPRITVYRFTEDEVAEGDTGVVRGPDASDEAPEGWLIVEIEGGPRYVPVHPSMIAPAERFTDAERATLKKQKQHLDAFMQRVLEG